MAALARLVALAPTRENISRLAGLYRIYGRFDDEIALLERMLAGADLSVDDLLRTGECVGDVTRLAPLYAFDQVPALVARKAAGPEHGTLTTTDGFDADLERLESLLQASYSESQLPPDAPNRDDINGFLVQMRRAHFTS